MQARSEKPEPVARAFTLFEVLIVLALLIGVSAVVLPAVLDRGLGDLLDDTRLRLDAAMLDAQREARRTGQTVQISLRTDNARESSEILIEPMPADPSGTGADTGAFGTEAEPWRGAGDGPATSGEPEGVSATTLAYALPDGTLVPAAGSLVLRMDGGSFELTIDAGASTVRLTPTTPAESDAEMGNGTGTPVAGPSDEGAAEDQTGGWSP